MKTTYFLRISAIALTAFALLTLFTSISIFFDLFGVRENEGNYVLFVVWSNFISSIFYLLAAYGILGNKKWASVLLGISSAVLITALAGLLVHINSGGIYETKTVSMMIFRIMLTISFGLIAYFLINKSRHVVSGKDKK